MKISLRNTIVFFTIGIALIVGRYTRQAGASRQESFPEVTIAGSELRTLESEETGRTYDLYVQLPADYDAEGDEIYPVLYLLDGQWDFKLLVSIYDGLLYDGIVPEMIIVGITYSGENPNYGVLRQMDYLPIHDRNVEGSGDAPKFLEFFKGSLIPFIEENYRTDPAQRILMGSSYGGTFTLYTMFTEPELFSGYVAASPEVAFGAAYSFVQEEQYADEHDELPVRLFLSVGELERLKSPVQGFMAVLEGRDYEGLELKTWLNVEERHAGVKPEAYNRGLRYIFLGHLIASDDKM
jgi:predicted alpha/beta superfamily hydrolase